MVINKLVCFALVYSLSNTPAYGLESKIDSGIFDQPLKRELKVTSGLDIQDVERQMAESYIKEVIPNQSKDYIRPESSLGKPDQRYAEILPGGELVVKMERPFSPMTFYNDGRVVLKEQEGIQDFSLAVLVPMIESEILDDKLLDITGTRKTITYAWREVLPGLVPGGFDMPFAPQIHVDTVKIVNTGKENLYLDAIIGYSENKK